MPMIDARYPAITRSCADNCCSASSPTLFYLSDMTGCARSDRAGIMGHARGGASMKTKAMTQSDRRSWAGMQMVQRSAGAPPVQFVNSWRDAER